MKREILFRGKRICENKNWVEGCLLNMDEDSGHVFIVPFFHHASTMPICRIVEYTSHYVNPETVGQFTGLTDKNGKKIFEGDIVKCRHRIYKISFEELEDKKIRRSYGKEIEEASVGGFNCLYWRNYAVSIYDGCVKIQNGSDSHYIRKNYIYNHAIEVIGNIHDNPELLEGGVEECG